MDVTITRDGIQIVAKYDYIDAPIVIMSHGIFGDMGYKEDSNFRILANQLHEKGFSTIRFDFNGHGKTVSKTTEMNPFSLILDLLAVFKFVKEKGHKEIFLLGHSQGGVISSIVGGLMHDQVKGVVLMAPAATLKDDAQAGRLMGHTYDSAHIPDTFALDDFYTFGGEYFRIAQVLPIYEIASQFTGPVCLIHGLQDEVVNPIASKRYHAAYQNSELHLMENENHNIKLRRQECFDIAIDFLVKNK